MEFKWWGAHGGSGGSGAFDPGKPSHATPGWTAFIPALEFSVSGQLFDALMVHWQFGLGGASFGNQLLHLKPV